MKIKKTINKTSDNKFIFVLKRAYGKISHAKHRAARTGKTSTRQKEINDKNAEKKLAMLIAENFGTAAYHLTLTYHNEVTSEEAKKELKNFLRRLRYAYAKHGKKLKYISVTEYLNNKLHHHLIINIIDEIRVEEIKADIWKSGFCGVTPLSEQGAYEALAAYLIKETSKTFNSERRFYGKRWTASKGLRLPEAVEEIIRGTENDIEGIPSSENFNGHIYELVKGSEEVIINEYGAVCFYIMRRRE